jgi:glutamate/aspartate transport system substrate-binding protein
MKLRSIVTATTLVLSAFSAQSSAKEYSGTLEKISDTGQIAIGYRESSIPFSYLNSDQKPVGYTIDLCKRIVNDIEQKLGKPVDIKYVPVNGKTRIPLMVNGTIDLECGSTTNTLTRQEQVEYLPTIFITGAKLLTKEGSQIRSVADLEGKKIGLPQGSNTVDIVKEEANRLGIKLDILPVSDHSQGFLALKSDRIDAYSSDDIILTGLIAKSKSPKEYRITDDFLSYDPYAIMIRRNDSAFELVGKRTLADLFRSGEIETIYNKWFEPLGMELTPLLETAFRIQAFPE